MESVKSRKVNPWMEHLKRVREANPQISYKQAMILAKESYKR